MRCESTKVGLLSSADSNGEKALGCEKKADRQSKVQKTCLED